MASVALVIHPSAESDIRLAYEWYEDKQYGLGRRFRKQIILAIESILDERREYSPVHQGLSAVFVKKFPYIIYYRKDNLRKRIVIFAVLHEKQNRQDILKKRL